MRTAEPVSDVELLDLLGRGESLSVPERAVLLARAADREIDANLLPLGERDALILRLRAQLFGPTLEAQDRCPQCHELASLEVDCTELQRAGSATDAAVIHVSVDGIDIVARPPTSADVIAAGSSSDAESARIALLSEIVLQAIRDDAPVAVTALPRDAVREVGRRVVESDPLAEISLSVTCDSCGGNWDTLLDPGDFVWRELREWGKRLLWEVHVLARSYGWPEHETLSLPPSRRQAYLRMVLGD